MKANRILFPLAAASLILTSCDDQVMEWKNGDPTVKPSEIPLELAEKIAKYDYLKAYMAQYHPNVQITLGMGLDNFLDDPDYQKVVLDNFQGVTFGNAMKHQSVVSASGNCDWSKVDRFIAMNTGLSLHGHNLLWHTQQQQNYLKSVIAPEMIISGDGDDGIANIITNGDFEGGTTNGWITNGSGYSASVVNGGHESDKALLCQMNDKTSSNWDSQLFWPANLEAGKTYVMRVWVKSPEAINIQALAQETTSGSYNAAYGPTKATTTDWMLYEWEFEYTSPEGVDRIGLQFGGTKNSQLYIDDFQFGEKTEAPSSLCPGGDFSDEGNSWNFQNKGAGIEVVEISDAPSGNKNVLKMTSSSSSSNAWDLQAITGDIPVIPGSDLEVSFFVKSESAGKGRISFSGLVNSYPWIRWTSSMSSAAEAFTTDAGAWTQVQFTINSSDFAEGATSWKMQFDFGYLPDVTYYVDNVMVSEAAAARSSRASRATTITYKAKTLEEKKAALLGAMEAWIKESMEHVGPYCSSWDVINEPIGDDCKFRGIDGGWMSSNEEGNEYQDQAPTETETEGLNLNWYNGAGNGHFYWGYYLGLDYAVKAFQYAAQYNPNGAKLFVNDYNLETSPNKLAKLIEFIEYIDNNGGHVDGIGTQMHVNGKSITKAQVDEMFKTMARTGKLVRITELDVAMGTASPSAEELQQQSDVYQMILTSYFENVPEAQQSAITMWTLTDNAKEHEYWLKDQSPNLFDSAFGRKIAYKGVCDAIAGFDVSAEWTSPDWSANK